MTLGRNDPCSCGSGKKYKKCCLETHTPTHTISTGNLSTQDRHNALTLRAIKAFQQHHFAEARTLAEQVLSENPNESEALHLIAALHMAEGNYKEAEYFAKRATASNPQAPHYHDTLGTILKNLGRPDEAIQEHHTAIALGPDISGNFYINLAAAFDENKQHPQALEALHHAMRLEPNNPRAFMLSGILHCMNDHYEEATKAFKRAIELDPKNPQHYNNLGTVHSKQARFREARNLYQHALTLSPNSREIWLNYCNATEEYCDKDETDKAFTELLKRFDLPGKRIKQKLLLPHIFDTSAALESARNAFEAQIENLITSPILLSEPEAEINKLPFYHAYHGKNDRTLMEKFERAMRACCENLSFTAPHCLRDTKTLPARPFRIGFVSKFFHDTVVSKCYAPMIEALAHTKPEYDYYFFAAADRQDHVTARMQSFAKEYLYLSKNVNHARTLIAQAECDLLLYLDIGMDPFSYFLAFARLAPIQCVIGGHPVTSGLSTMDYYISTTEFEPENAAEHYSETLVLLPQNPGSGPRPAPFDHLRSRHELGLPEKGRLYLCPVSPHKLHPDFYQAFAEILARDEQAHIVLFRFYREQTAWVDQLTHVLQNHIPKEHFSRLHFHSWETPERFSQILLHADTVLDSWHFSMGSTAYIVLGLGIPLITWPGEFMRGRAAFGLYNRMGISEMIANSRENYIKLALKTAQDQNFRKSVSDKIKEKNHLLFETQYSSQCFAEWIERVLKPESPKRSSGVQLDLFSAA